MRRPLISVVVPVYNVEKYLSTCLESIINQSYTNLNIVLVNDGSTDGSLLLCEEYSKKDPRIMVVNKQNGGVSSARNLGIQKSTGEYICFVDADDYIFNDYVEYLYNLIKDDEDIDISLTTELSTNYCSNKTSKCFSYITTGADAAILILSYRIPIGCYCKLFRRNFIEKNSISFFEDLSMGEGFNFNFLCFQNSNKVAIGNKKIYYYRQDNSLSATSTFSMFKCENGLFAIDRIIDNNFLRGEKIVAALDFAKWRTLSDMTTSLLLAKKDKEYRNTYIGWKKQLKRRPKQLNLLPISFKNKFRLLLFSFSPKLVVFLRRVRSRLHGMR